MYGPDDFYGNASHGFAKQDEGPVEKPIADFFKKKISDRKFVNDPEGGVQPIVEDYFKQAIAKRKK